MNTYHPAFETLSEFPVTEYRAFGVHLRHRTTGCEVFHLRSEDEENTFAFCFRTPSPDGTGVAHIVEHSVLCLHLPGPGHLGHLPERPDVSG